MPVNKWIIKRNKEKIDDYLETADYIIVERQKFCELLMNIFSHHFVEKQNLELLDLGCGDGFLTRQIAGQFPKNAFSLLDGSPKMLRAAMTHFKGKNFRFLHATFSQAISNTDPLKKYDFIYSSMAIHHLSYPDKKRLYKKIYTMLTKGGLFLNIDTVQPNSRGSERCQFEMWQDWMAKNLCELRRKNIRKFDFLPGKYKNNKENVPSGLFAQLAMLTDAGFKDVDCFYKHGIFSLFGGVKYPSPR